VIRAKSAAKAEAKTKFIIQQDILVRGGKVDKESLFIDKILIATKDSKNHYNKESELDNSIYINRAAIGDKTLKDA
jgi:hypothetical protein